MGKNQLKKYQSLDKSKVKDFIRADIKLWQVNDVRTRCQTTLEMFKVNHTRKRIALPAAHVYVPNDQYFNQDKVNKNMAKIFKTYKPFLADIKSHAPSLISGKEEAAQMIPSGLAKLLKK